MSDVRSVYVAIKTKIRSCHSNYEFQYVNIPDEESANPAFSPKSNLNCSLVCVKPVGSDGYAVTVSGNLYFDGENRYPRTTSFSTSGHAGHFLAASDSLGYSMAFGLLGAMSGAHQHNEKAFTANVGIVAQKVTRLLMGPLWRAKINSRQAIYYGLFGFLLGPLFSILGIITGYLALSRATQDSPREVHSHARGGIITGIVSFLIWSFFLGFTIYMVCSGK